MSHIMLEKLQHCDIKIQTKATQCQSSFGQMRFSLQFLSVICFKIILREVYADNMKTLQTRNLQESLTCDKVTNKVTKAEIQK